MSHAQQFFLSLVCVCFATSGLAQIGDRSDRPGETQKSVVPADQIPPAPALSPEEALKSFRLPPRYKVEIAAADPLVQDPVAIAFDADGRLWVVEMRGYLPDLDGVGEDQPVGRISVLDDTNGDGRYDHGVVFLDGLVLPRAIALVGDGALIGAPPELAFWRDTNGDGKADTKTVLATDYGVKVDPKRPYLANPERAPNSLTWAADNWIYSAAYTRKFRYRKGEWTTGTTSFRGQWGLSQDDFGRFYYNSNSDQLRADLIFSDYLQRNPNQPRLTGANVNLAVDQWVWPIRVTPGINRGYRPEMLRDGRLKAFTAACAPWVYRGDLMPELYGSVFVAEPAGNLVRRNILSRENGQLHARNAHERGEFMASTDERFRPVNFATGPDGALYVVDLYRGVIEHRISLTTYLRRQSEERNLVQPQNLGRIYRIVPSDRPAPRATQIRPLTAGQWVERLSHPNSWWRETAQRTLVERTDHSMAPAIRDVATRGPQSSGRVHALWVLEGMGALDRTTVINTLADEAPIVRAAALRLSERFLFEPGREELITLMLELSNDSSPEVQLQAILSLGEARDPLIDVAAAETVCFHPKNAFLRDAFYSGVRERELPLIERLAASTSWPRDGYANEILGGLSRAIFLSRQASAIERIFELIAELPGDVADRGAALLEGMASVASTMQRPVQFSFSPAKWAQLAGNGWNQTHLDKLERAMEWPHKPGLNAKASVTPLTVSQRKRFDAGRELFATACAVCHQATGQGLEGVAPPLLDSDWVTGTHERTVRILLHGVRGPISVRGNIFVGDMPGFGGLNDEQIASIATYVRREWGHTADPVEPDHVKAIRAATAAQADAWSPEELLQIK